MTQSLPPKSFILYADDDRDDIDLVRDIFEDYSQSVELKTFSDGLALLDYIRGIGQFEPAPCLIILDINMPRKDGKETLCELRTIEGYEDVPVVLFSTSTLPSEMAFAKSFNAGFVTKPLHIDQIHQLVDRMLDHCSDEVKNNFKKMKGR